MKKNIFVSLAAAVVLLFSSCSKDIDLAGTTWKSDPINTNDNLLGESVTLIYDATINFTDATNYTNTTNATITFMGQTIPYSRSVDGTYTFNGENGMFDGEHPFTYDKKDKTITMVSNINFDPIGDYTITLTFTQMK